MIDIIHHTCNWREGGVRERERERERKRKREREPAQ